MDKKSNYQFIADVALGVIKEIAPQETPIFKAASEAYFKDPSKATSQNERKDQVLGFGIAEASSFITPMALAVTSEVVTFLISEVKKSLEKESLGVIDNAVKSLFKRFRPHEKKPAITLTPEQLKEVHKIAHAKALALKLSSARAEQLADSLVCELAI
ncbi:MAG: hypothetical protein U0V02_22115 [Anaerolineales bacterium]